jgi:hypothetical protein
MTKRFTGTTGAVCVGLLWAASAGSVRAADVQVTIENPQSSGQFFLTPFWIAAHNGQFDSYDGGSMAPAFLTPLAELGDTGPISTAFTNSPAGGGAQATVTAVAGMGDAPVFSPGESTQFTLNVNDPAQNQYFSYASMVVPSNDLFVANGNPTAHQIFDANGDFTGPVTIEIFGSAVNDNGTEVNNANGDAAFSVNGGMRMAESNVIRNLFTQAGDADYLASFIGSGTASGDTITSAFGASDLVARIIITPEPASAALLGLGGLVALRRRRNVTRA